MLTMPFWFGSAPVNALVGEEGRRSRGLVVLCRRREEEEDGSDGVYGGAPANGSLGVAQRCVGLELVGEETGMQRGDPCRVL